MTGGLRGALGKSLWAAADQAFASGGNFLANVILARVLDELAYGAFAVAYQSFWLFAMVHGAIVAEPVLVLAAGRFRDEQSEYVRTVMLGHFGLVAVVSAVCAGIGAAAFAMSQRDLAAGFAGIAVAAPGILTLVTLRRVAHANHRPHVGAIAGAAHLALFVALFVALSAVTQIGLLAAFGVLCVAATLAASGTWFGLRLRSPFAAPWPLGPRIWKEHRHFARWGLPAGISGWVPGNVFYVVLPILPGAAFGLEATATLRALMNLVMPMLQLNAGVANQWVSAFSSQRRDGGRLDVVRRGLALAALSGVAWLALGTLGPALMDWLYAGRYAVDPQLFWLVGAVPVLTAVAHGLRSAILAHERPDQMFWSYFVAALVTIAAGLPLVLAWGLKGVLVTMLIAAGCQLVVMVAFVVRNRRADALG